MRWAARDPGYDWEPLPYRTRLLPILSLALIAVNLVACAGGNPAPRAPDAAGPGSNSAPKRIVASIQGDPHTLYQTLNPASRVRGIDTLEQLVNAGLTQVDTNGVMRAQLAEQVPSIENGLWKVQSDGRME